MKTRTWLGAGLLAGLLSFPQTGCAAITGEQNLEKTFRAAPGGKLVIDADRGAIEVAPNGGEQVRVRALRKVKGGTKARAEALLANHEVTFSQSGDTVTVIAKDKKPQLWTSRLNRPSLEVRYEVSVPAKYNVDLKTGGGDVRVDTLEGEAAVRTSSGAIVLGKISGKVQAGDSGGDISIQEAGSQVTAHTSSGAIKVQKAAGKVEASNSGGNIYLAEAGSDVLATTSSGGITLLAVKGAVEARDSGGNIRIDEAGGDVTVQTSSGSIQLGTVRGRSVKARNSGGSIDLAEAAGGVSVETSSGSISLRTVRGKLEAKDSGGNIAIGEAGDAVVAQTSSGSIKISKARGSVDASDSGGDIRIEQAAARSAVRTSSGTIRIGLAEDKVEARNAGGSIEVADAQGAVLAQTSSGHIQVNFSVPPKAESRLEVSGGGVTVGLPASAGIDLDARSSGGTVISDLPITLAVQGAPRPNELRGKLNGGGPSLILRASAGDIRLKKSAAAPAQAETEAEAR